MSISTRPVIQPQQPISKKILEEGAPARDAYKEFLKTGSSDYPVELLKIAGVDMSSKEPVVMAMETFKKLVDEFRKTIVIWDCYE